MADGFDKIELPNVPVVNNAAVKVPSNDEMKKRTKPKKKLFNVKVIGLVVFVIAIFSIFFVILPAIDTYKSARATYQQAKLVADAMKNQNIDKATSELEKTKKELSITQKKLRHLSYLRFIPIVNWYYNDVDHMLKAGSYGLDSATLVLESLKPYADILGLKGEGTSFVMGSAEDRIKTAVMTIGKITPNIDRIADSLLLVKKEIDYVNPGHYPAFLFGSKIHGQIAQAKELADTGASLVDESRPLIKVIPSLLGDSKEKKYLVLFQNDKELRATGGFLTAYAIFRIDKGIIHVDQSSDIYNLDNTFSPKPKAPEPILKYLPRVYTFNLRDSNLSPDYIESMKTFYSMYQKSGGYKAVDGIIALDTHVLVSTIRILDDEVYAGGEKFTSQKVEECDCPQVIYKLESLISTPKSIDLSVDSLAEVQARRKDMIGVLLYAIMEKALKSSPSQYWGRLFQDAIMQADQKHVLFYLFDKDAQSGIEALNVAGRIKDFDGDYLHINDTNFGGAKANLFTTEEVEVKYGVEEDGVIVKTITLQYNNPYEPSDCNLERGRLCINAPLRNWLRIYTPKGSTLIDSKGSEVKVTTYDELGKTVFDGFLTIRPKGKSTFTISYRLPFKLERGSPLPVLIQKQPGTDGNEYSVIVKGKKVEKFQLFTDKKLQLKL